MWTESAYIAERLLVRCMVRKWLLYQPHQQRHSIGLVGRNGQEDLLMYQEYVIFKGLDTIIDEHCIQLGLKWNVLAAPFNPKIILKPHKEPKEQNCTVELKDEQSINVVKSPAINTPEAKEEQIIIKKNRYTSNHNIVKNNTTKNTNVVNNTFSTLQDFEEDGLSKVYGNANETGERDTINTKSDQRKTSPDYNVKSMSREMMEKVIEE